MDAMSLMSALGLLAASPLVVVPQPAVDIVGDCVAAQGKSADLHTLMFLENRSIDIVGSKGSVRVTLNGERVQIRRIGPSADGAIYSLNIGDEVAPNDDLDVELKLGYMSGQLVLYWKETYQHRIYRQGLFGFFDDRVRSICSGRGGVNTSN
jgi:hypothetical protein